MRPSLKSLPKRFAHFVFIVWLTVTLVFIALVLIRGNPISLFLDPRLTPELQEQLKTLHGYDRPPFEQYIRYMGNLLQGEMGFSFNQQKPVTEAILGAFGKTVRLGCAALLMGSLICVLLLYGLHTGPRWSRRMVEVVQSVLVATPGMIAAIVLIAVFGVWLKWFPIFGSRALFAPQLEGWDAFWSAIHHGFLPALSLALPIAGQFSAYLHEQMLDMEKAPFLLSAKGRGVSENQLFFNHLLRSMAPTVVQLLGLYLPMLAQGALVIEVMFGWSGLGVLMLDALMSRDYPLLLGGVVFTALFVAPGYELADYARHELRKQGVAE